MLNTVDDRVFKALSAPTRRALLDALKDRPQTTGELCARVPDLDRCTVMQHLTVLEEADLVFVRREGRERWNHLNPLPIKDIQDRLMCLYEAQALVPPQPAPPAPQPAGSTAAIPEF